MDIFISYASKNRATVNKLAEDLADIGHSVWFDKQLSGAQHWWNEILAKILDCDLFIFALTPESLDSNPCRLEYQYAYQLGKRILPVLLSEVNTRLVPPELGAIQFVDYRADDKKAALALNRALNLLPPPQPLPDSLPTPPAIPFSPLAEISVQLDAPALDADQQRLLVSKLSEFLRNPDTADDARTLLYRLRRRADLLASVDREIERSLSGAKPNVLVPRILSIRNRELIDCKFVQSPKWAIVSSLDRNITIIDLISGKEIMQFATEFETRILGTSQDGQLVALAYYEQDSGGACSGFGLVDIERGIQTKSISFPASKIEHSRVRPDFKSIGFVRSDYSFDDNVKSYQFIEYDFETSEQILVRDLDFKKPWLNFQISPDLRRIVVIDRQKDDEMVELSVVDISDGDNNVNCTFADKVMDAHYLFELDIVLVLESTNYRETPRGVTGYQRLSTYNLSGEEIEVIDVAQYDGYVKVEKYGVSSHIREDIQSDDKFVVRYDDKNIRIYDLTHTSKIVEISDRFNFGAFAVLDISDDGAFVIGAWTSGIFALLPIRPEEYRNMTGMYAG
jgi:hypothetical protein